MRPALALFCLFLFCDTTPLSAQTFGLGGVTETRLVRSRVFGLGEGPLVAVPTVKQHLPVATYKESLVVQTPTVQQIQTIQPQTICIDGRCYPAASAPIQRRQPLFRRWR